MILRIPRHVEWIAKAARELLDAAVGIDTKDFSAVPLRERRDLHRAVVADADDDRAVDDDRIAAMMFGRDAVLGIADVAREFMHDGFTTGGEIDARDHVVGLIRTRVVNDRRVVVGEGHAEESGVAGGIGGDDGDGGGVIAIEAEDLHPRHRQPDRQRGAADPTVEEEGRGDAPPLHRSGTAG